MTTPTVDETRTSSRAEAHGGGATGRRARLAWVVRLAGSALVAAAVSLVACLAFALLIWATANKGTASVGDALRAGTLAWVAGQGVPVSVDAVTLGLLPWGLGLLSACLLFAGGRRAARGMAVRGRADLAWVAGGVLLAAFAFGVCVSWAADLSWRPDARAVAVEAVARGALLALLALGAGTMTGLKDRAEATAGETGFELPGMVITVLRAGSMAALSLLGAGAVLAALSLLTHFDDAVNIQQSLAAGGGGGLGLLLLCVAYVPVLAVWGAAYLVGAGVIVGAGVTVSPFVQVTAPVNLPAMPLLAAVPAQASPLAWLLPVVAIAIGLLAGVAVARAQRGAPRLVRLGLAVVSAAVTGLLMAGAAFLAAGPLGDQRLAYVGPVPLTVAVLAFGLVVLGAVPASLLGGERPSRDRHLSVAPAAEAGPGGSTGSELVASESLPSESQPDEPTTHA